MAGSVNSNCTGYKFSRYTAFLAFSFFSPCGLLLLGPQSGVHQLSATTTRSVGHIISFFRSPDRSLHSTALVTFLGEVLVLLRLELALIFLSMLRSGLNSHLTPFQTPVSISTRKDLNTFSPTS